MNELATKNANNTVELSIYLPLEYFLGFVLDTFNSSVIYIIFM